MSDQMQAEALMHDIQELSAFLNKRRNKPISINGLAPISKASLNLLKAVGAHPGDRMSDIAQHMSVTKGAVSQLATRLSAEGLLDKQAASGSARDICLVLTDSGRQLYEASGTLDDEMESDIVNTLTQLSAEDVESLRALIRRISDRMASVELPTAN